MVFLVVLLLLAPTDATLRSIPEAHIFVREFSHAETAEQWMVSIPADGCVGSVSCGWSVVDELGAEVLAGTAVTNDQLRSNNAGHQVIDVRVNALGVGFYRAASAAGAEAAAYAATADSWPNDASAQPAYTTIAVLRAPSPGAVWPPPDSPVAIDSAFSWLIGGHTAAGPPNASSRPAAAKAAALAGCGWVRDRISWGDLNPKPGLFGGDPRGYMNSTQLTTDAGSKTLEVFSGTPVDFVCANHTYNSHKGMLPCVNDSIPSAGPDDSTYENIPRNLTHIFEFTKYLSRFFGKNVAAYESWNEGNLAGQGGQTADQLAAFQKAAYIGYQAAGAAAPIVSNNVIAEAGDNRTTEQVVKSRVDSYFDTYNIHTYTSPSGYEQSFAGARQAASGRPLWLSEFGIHLATVTAPPWSDMSPDTDLQQAMFIAHGYVNAFFAGVDRAFYFVLINYIEGNLQYGLLRYDMTPRPAYVALSTVGYYLANAKVIGMVEVVNSTGSVRGERSPACTAALVKDCAVAIDSCVNQTQWPCALCEICIIENDAALTSAGCTPADELKFCSARGIPDAKVFVFSSTPGNGVPKDVLVMYCEPTGFNDDLASNVCGVPAAVASLTESVEVYDYLGRQLGGVSKLADVPTVTSFSLFAVLPAGSTNTLALRPSPASAPKPPGPSKGSDIVLEPQFPYATNQLGLQAHELEPGFYDLLVWVYNFGDTPRSGSITVAGGDQLSLNPNKWAHVTVPPQGRTSIEASITVPQSLQVSLEGLPVTFTGDFEDSADVAPPVAFFKVVPNFNSIKPSSAVPVIGSDDAVEYSANMAGPGHMVRTNGPTGCVQFSFEFAPATPGVWAFPQLVVNGTNRPPAGAQGIRFLLRDVSITPPGNSLPSLTVLFWNNAKVQYEVAIGHAPFDASAPPMQVQTALFVASSSPGAGPLAATDVWELSVGLTDGPRSVVNMTVCEMQWVTF